MKLFDCILNLLFPPKCVFCRRIIASNGPGICQECEAVIRSPEPLKGVAFRTCYAAMPYDESARRAIARFKFEDHPEYAEVFAPLLADVIRQQVTEPYDLISWVPVSRKRLRKRGYDQSELLGKATVGLLGQELTPTLKKVRNNAAQSGMKNAGMRRENVKGVYTVINPQHLFGKRVLLMDDIVTTGATLEEAAASLLSGGASSVVCVALAHPEKRNNNKEEH